MADLKKKKDKKPSKSRLYKVDGESVKRARVACPKCGPGVFLGQHKDRVACGNCGFLEWKK
ncbi:MAG: 30S ribosomal protein S27ae [archaeon]